MPKPLVQTKRHPADALRDDAAIDRAVRLAVREELIKIGKLPKPRRKARKKR